MSVIFISEWPNRSEITVIGTFIDNNRDAWLCLKSCILIFLTFAISQYLSFFLPIVDGDNDIIISFDRYDKKVKEFELEMKDLIN